MATTASFLLPCITPIRMMRGELVLSTASGFFLKQDEQWFLVSNWHNFAGRRSDNGQPLHKHGALPDICAYHCAHLSDDKLSWKSHQIDLGDATTNDATWFQHPDRGQEVDLAVIPIPAESVGKSKDLLAPDVNDVDMLVDLGGEVFVPGYSLGITGGGAFPIWKRASIASPLEFGHGVNSHFFIDTASREGMSGAPCIAISNWQHYRLNRETGKVKVIHRPLSWRLMGVYSGRLNAKDDLGAQLGIVWRTELMLETIAAKKQATVKLYNTT